MEGIHGEARAIAGAAEEEAEGVPRVTTLRCFIAVLEEHSADKKQVG